MPELATDSIPEEACRFKFVHASGPGGQHVNKSSTAVELRVDIHKLGLSPSVLTRLRTQQRNRITKDGVLVIQAEQFRSQLKNRKAALERVAYFIQRARIVPKKRVATKPSRAAKARRLNSKKQRGQVKANRRSPKLD